MTYPVQHPLRFSSFQTGRISSLKPSKAQQHRVLFPAGQEVKIVMAWLVQSTPLIHSPLMMSTGSQVFAQAVPPTQMARACRRRVRHHREQHWQPWCPSSATGWYLHCRTNLHQPTNCNSCRTSECCRRLHNVLGNHQQHHRADATPPDTTRSRSSWTCSPSNNQISPRYCYRKGDHQEKFIHVPLSQ